MKIDFLTLTERLKGLDPYIHLTLYIYCTLGNKCAKLDYNAAAKALGVDRRSIGRYITVLAERQIIDFEGGKLRLTEEIFKAG